MEAIAAPQEILRKLEWRVRHVADSSLGGEYRSAFRGRGREFDQVVRYEWGDDIRDIDWNVTARLGEPYRKKFVEERELTVVFLFEDSLSLQFGSGECTKREGLLELASLFALVSAANRDRAGFWHATPAGEEIRRPSRGRSAIVKTAAQWIGLPPPRFEEGDRVQIDWKKFRHAFPRHSVVLWLGDFDARPVPEEWLSLREQYQVIGVRVDDPWERELPRIGEVAALDPVDGELVPFDTNSRANRKAHAAWVEAREQGFRTLFPRPADRLVLEVGEDPLHALVRFFRARTHWLKG
ncbi:MAG: DUF58 domain-containing protein [Myxococcota bacterium]|nr:DUF58 domain-containing protein [Myxococcota bacterium]